MKKNNKAFSLIEILIVIVALAILGTIAFVSMQGFYGNSRNSSRVTDLNNMKKAIDLSAVKTGSYPTPDSGIDVLYNDSLAWTQGTFGNSVTQKIQGTTFNKKPVDPGTKNEYTYSLSGNKKEYTLGAIKEGTNLSYSNLPLNHTNAFGEKISIAMLIGNYNGKILTISTGTNNYVLAIPSIVTSDLSTPDLITILNNKSLVYDGFTNLPSSYSNKGYTMTGGFNYGPSNPTVYIGNIMDLKNSKSLQQQFITNIQGLYNGTQIENMSNIKPILDITSNSDKEDLVMNFIENDVGGLTARKTLALSTSDVIQNLTQTQAIIPPSFSGVISSTTDLWTLSDSNLVKIFSPTSNWYSSNWKSSYNHCKTSSIRVDTTTFTPGNIGYKQLSSNTIYKIPNGTYILNGPTSYNGHIKIYGDCVALVGESPGGVIFTGSNTSGGYVSDRGIIDYYNRDNIIVANITINGNKGSVNKYGYGIRARSNLNNTINNIISYNNNIGGIYMLDNSDNNTINNSIVYNNTSFGIYLNNASNVTINNSNIFNNSYGVHDQNHSNNNVFNNLQSYNNDYGFYIDHDCFNSSFNNLSIYNNSYGLLLQSNTDNNVFNSVRIYDNTNYGIYFSGVSSDSNKYFGTLKLFSNGNNFYGTSGNDSRLSPGISSLIGWGNGILDTTGSMTCSYHSQPNLSSTWGTNCIDKNEKTSGLVLPVTSYNYGASIQKQIQPVECPTGKNCSIGSYLTSTGAFDSSKYIGEWY